MKAWEKNVLYIIIYNYIKLYTTVIVAVTTTAHKIIGRLHIGSP